MGAIDDRLKTMNISLPEPPKPVASYVPYVVTGNHVFISGQIPVFEDKLMKGRLGEDWDVEKGQKAARLCAINLVAQLRMACDGDLDKVSRVVKLGGFVNATPDFVDIPQVINGASDFMVEVFSERGRHARSAVACPSLPLGVGVEVDGVFELY